MAASAALASPRIAFGQAKLPRIGLLWNDSVRPSPYYVTLVRALSVKGYTVDRNFKIEDRISLEGYGPVAGNAAELVRSKVDVIVTYGSTATLAAAKATKDIPIVMIAGLDPVGSGIAQSLARPGRNVTGVSFLTEDLNAKRVQILKELMPGLQRLGILYDPDGRRASTWLREIEATARSLKLEAKVVEFRKLSDLDSAFAALEASHAEAIIPVSSSFLASHADYVVALAARYRKPVIYSGWRYSDVGGLASYHGDIQWAIARAADYVHRILNGALPGDLPIEQATKVELVVNLRTANALGLTVPQSVLSRADRVIE